MSYLRLICRCRSLALVAAAIIGPAQAQGIAADQASHIAPARPACLQAGEATSPGQYVLRACEELDGVRRYHSNVDDYGLASGDVGQRELTAVVTRALGDGSTQTVSAFSQLTVDAETDRSPKFDIRFPTDEQALVVFPNQGWLGGGVGLDGDFGGGFGDGGLFVETIGIPTAPRPPGLELLRVQAWHPDGIAYVDARIAGRRYEMQRIDDVNFVLRDSAGLDQSGAYDALARQRQVDFYLGSEDGSESYMGALSGSRIALDQAPVLNLLALPESLIKGDQIHIGVQLIDAGRNVTEVTAYWDSGDCRLPDGSGDSEADACTVMGGIRHSETTFSLGGDRLQWLGQISVDDYLLRVPIRAPYDAATQAGRVCVFAEDHDLNISSGACQAVDLLPPIADPHLEVLLPTYRVPAGQRVPVVVSAEHLGFVEQYSVALYRGDTELGRVAGTVAEQTRWQRRVSIDLPQDAAIGEAFAVRAVVTAEGGRTATRSALVFAGDWGERTEIIAAPRQADIDLLYADVVIQSGAELQIADPVADTAFNSLDLRDGSVVIGREGVNGQPIDPRYTLTIRERLDIAAGQTLRVLPHRAVASAQAGAHAGGSSPTNPGYGSFMDADFPGAADGPSARGFDLTTPLEDRFAGQDTGGSALFIQAKEVVINGDVQADGRAHSGGYAGAGGSVRIEAESLSGTGRVLARGGAGVPRGAGGRIAIVAPSISLNPDGVPTIDLVPTPGAGQGVLGGAGTAHIRHAGSVFGSLFVSVAPGFATANQTLLGGVGRADILDVQAVDAQTYRITRSDSGRWPVRDPLRWQSGLAGLHVRLDAADRDAPIYEIVDNTEQALDIRVTPGETVFAGERLQGVVRLDQLRIGAGARLASQDLIYASVFEGDERAALEAVFSARSDTVVQVDAFDNGQSRGLLVADVIADAMTLDAGAVPSTVYGQVTVNGLADISGGALLDVRGPFSAGSLVLSNATVIGTGPLTAQSDAIVSDNGVLSAQRLTIQGNLFVDSGGAVDAADDLNVLDETVVTGPAQLTAGQAMVFGGDVDLAGGRLSAPVIRIENLADLTVEQGAQVDASQRLQVSGNLLGATDAQIRAPVVAASFTQVDGELGQVVLAANRWTGDMLIMLDAVLRPWRNPDQQVIDPIVEVDLSRTLYVGRGAQVDASDTARVGLHALRYPSCAEAGTAHHAGLYVQDAGINGCAYGRYDWPAYPGSDRSSQPGGGILRIGAESIVVQGALLADGLGAGGSILAESRVLTGSGQLSVVSRSTGGGGGSGGRIAVFTDNWDRLTITTQASGHNAHLAAPAGTIYISDDPGNPGHLIVAGGEAADTSPGSVGRHTITSVQALGDNRWRITAADPGWPASTHPDQGLVGRLVVLDANAPDAEPLAVLDNTADTLIVASPANLAGSVGQTLSGFHVLETIRVSDGAGVDFAGDRVIVLDQDSLAAFDFEAANANP